MCFVAGAVLETTSIRSAPPVATHASEMPRGRIRISARVTATTARIATSSNDIACRLPVSRSNAPHPNGFPPDGARCAENGNEPQGTAYLSRPTRFDFNGNLGSHSDSVTFGAPMVHE